MRSAILGVCLLVAGCGKVGEPKPPFIRIPEAVKDLSATQSGHDIVLSWTNPARNIDNSAATNLAHVQIRTGNAPVTTVNAGEPGKVQSVSLPVMPGSDATRTFSLVVDTRQGKVSGNSNIVSITPVEVPGKIAEIHSLVDQNKISLSWTKPQEHPELADAYIVIRTDRPAESEVVSDTRYEDMRYQRGRTFTYQVTPARRVGERIVNGMGTARVSVLVEDKTPPQAPSGLDIVESDNNAYLTWDPNMETDLAGYHVFRSERAEGPFSMISKGTITQNQFVDPNYKPGMYYSVSATDESGNESPRSPAFRAP
ncbi:MAG TPA: hypothetical protein VKY31_06730 [Terriglobia bacterium]|nr:hypothetical protein [Terriglobia bacterium]